MKYAAPLAAVWLACAGCSRADADPFAAEVAERERFARAAMLAADAGRSLNVSSTSEIQYEEGFSLISFDPPDDFHAHAFRWMGQFAHVRLKTHGARPMRLVVGGWINESVVRSRPVLTLTIDGRVVAVSGPVDKEHFRSEVVVQPSYLERPWVDLVIHTNTVAFHWGEPPALKVQLLYLLEWNEAP